MASTPKEDLISKLERRYLECNVCTEIFNEDERLPRLLPCQHTFCSLCLKKLRIKESIKCPSCNALHGLGKRGILEFPKDNIRRDLTSFLQTQDGISASLRCSKCKSSIHIEACYICLQCKVLFCNVCRIQHKNKKPSHDLYLKSNDAKSKITDNVCQNYEHENAPLKFFCISCQIGVCALCALNEHRDIRMHHLQHISQAFQERKASLTTSLDKLREKILTIRSLQDKYADIDTLLKHEQMTFSEEIQQIFNKGVGILNQHKQKLQTHNMNLYKTKQQEISVKKEKVASFINNAEECYNLSEQMIETKNMTSFLHFHKTLEHHINMFLDESIHSMANFVALTNTEKDNDFKAFEDLVAVIENLTKKCGEVCQQIPPGHWLMKQNVEQKPKTLAPEYMQKIRHEMTVCRKRIGIGTTVCMKKVKHAFSFHNRRSNNANSEAVNHENKCWKIAKPILFIIVLFLFMHVPARYVFTELEFNTHTWTSDFQCRSIDNKTVSLMAEKNMICGSPQRPIPDYGVFANITFLPTVDNDVEFTITVKNLTKKNHFYGHVLFQFGLAENHENGSLKNHTSIFGHICPYYAGICLSVNRNVDVMKPKIFTEKRGTTDIQGTFRVKSYPTDSSISVFTKSSKQPVFEISNFRQLRFAFRAFKEFEMPVFVSLTKKYPVSFDRFTLFPSLFISDDNKIVSTISTSLLKHKVKWKRKRAIFTAFDKAEVSGPDIRSVITIDVMGRRQSTKTELYEFGFGYFKNDIYVTLTKSKLIQDNTKSPRYYVETGSTSSKLSPRIYPLEGQYRLFVHYNTKKGAIVVSSNGYALGGVFSYKLPYNYRSPVFFLRNINAHNIKAQWSKYVYIYEPILSELFMYFT